MENSNGPSTGELREPELPDEGREGVNGGAANEARAQETPFTAFGSERRGVEGQLAQFAFTREEREREVRLTFRDVPADEVALAFRAAGAMLITVSGERAGRNAGGAEAQTPSDVTLRYFYSLGEMVYTISITSTSGVFGSVAAIFPVATLSEQELGARLAVAFQEGR